MSRHARRPEEPPERLPGDPADVPEPAEVFQQPYPEPFPAPESPGVDPWNPPYGAAGYGEAPVFDQRPTADMGGYGGYDSGPYGGAPYPDPQADQVGAGSHDVFGTLPRYPSPLAGPGEPATRYLMADSESDDDNPDAAWYPHMPPPAQADSPAHEPAPAQDGAPYPGAHAWDGDELPPAQDEPSARAGSREPTARRGSRRSTASRSTVDGAQPEPVEVNDVRIVLIGTLTWLAAFLALLPFRAQLQAGGHGQWLWTCLAGAGLGLIGLYYVHRRREALRQHETARATRTGEQGPDTPLERDADRRHPDHSPADESPPEHDGDLWTADPDQSESDSVEFDDFAGGAAPFHPGPQDEQAPDMDDYGRRGDYQERRRPY